MKKIFIISFLLFLVSCNNGDIEVPSFDFESEIYSCDNNTVLYIANNDNTEVLILQLPVNTFGTTPGLLTIPLTSENCNYRLFDAAFYTDYFCSTVPPVDPKVLKNWVAVTGDGNNILIETKVLGGESAAIDYEYVITLENLVLQSDEERITYDTFNFGVFTLE